MIEKKINILIPSVKISEELIVYLNGINKLNYKNFIVSIILDKKNQKN